MGAEELGQVIRGIEAGEHKRLTFLLALSALLKEMIWKSVFAAGVAALGIGVASHPAAAAAPTTGVVDVTTTLGYQNGAAAGTGMMLTSTGEVLTNNHVIRGETDLRVIDPSTGQSYAATVSATA